MATRRGNIERLKSFSGQAATEDLFICSINKFYWETHTEKVSFNLNNEITLLSKYEFNQLSLLQLPPLPRSNATIPPTSKLKTGCSLKNQFSRIPSQTPLNKKCFKGSVSQVTQKIDTRLGLTSSLKRRPCWHRTLFTHRMSSWRAGVARRPLSEFTLAACLHRH